MFQAINTPRFNFFDKEILKDIERDGQNFDKLKVSIIYCHIYFMHTAFSDVFLLT